ncbi:hypothetical protein ACRAWF_21330 [Streptomyces sp. L7]
MFIYGSVLPHLSWRRRPSVSPLQGTRPADLGSYATFGMLVGALTAGTVGGGPDRPQAADDRLRDALLAGLRDLRDLGQRRGSSASAAPSPASASAVICRPPRSAWSPTTPRAAVPALTIGMLMTAHHAGGILSAYVAKWPGGPGRLARRLLGLRPSAASFVPVLLKFLPESLSFLVAKGRTDEATALAGALRRRAPAATGKKTAADRWDALRNLFTGGQWIQTLLYWFASFGGLLLVYGVATWLPTLMARAEGYALADALTFVVVFNLGGIVGMLAAGRAADRSRRSAHLVDLVRADRRAASSSSVSTWARP